MKLIMTTTAAIVMAMSAANAGTTVTRSNVACDNISASGFTVIGTGGRDLYVETRYASVCPAGVNILPEGMTAFDEDLVAAYLGDNSHSYEYLNFTHEETIHPVEAEEEVEIEEPRRPKKPRKPRRH